MSKPRFLLAALLIAGGCGFAALAADRPNVLLAIADDISYPHQGAYGCAWVKTPGFDRVAREGLLFNRAYTPNAKCAPSRACLLTGRNSWQLGAAANHIPFFPPEFKTYVEALAEHGYFVGKTGKGWAPGVAVDVETRPRQLAGTPFDRRRLDPPTPAISRNDYAGNFAEFLDAAPSDGPWCFWYGSSEPHRPYTFGSGVALGGKQLADIDRVPGFWPDTDTIRNDLLDYAFALEHFDRHLMRMLTLLEERGQLENTLVVVTADHGMPFPRAKGQAYEFSNHVPLAIQWPRGINRPGRVIDDYVSFIDLAPTFIEVAGLAWPDTGLAPSPGRSLTDIFRSASGGQVNPARDHVLIGKERHDIGRPNDWGYPIRGIVKGNQLYLRNFEPSRWPAGNPETGYLNCDGSPTKTAILERRRAHGQDRYWDLSFGKRPAEELFDLRADPDCLDNLAGRPEFDRLRQALATELETRLKAQNDPRMLGQGHRFEQEPYASEAQRNFHTRFLSGEPVRAGWVNPSDFEPEPFDE
jgi:N-sulfoglucosamine sulfohydrolase